MTFAAYPVSINDLLGGAVITDTGAKLEKRTLGSTYKSDGFFDEMYDTHGRPRAEYHQLHEYLLQTTPENIEQLQRMADLSLLNQGITFTVYSDARGTEKIFPFGIIPRVIAAREWSEIEAGVVQRLKALNLFLFDLYHEQAILKDGIVPTDLIVNSSLFCREMTNLDVPDGVYVHVGGIDLIRNETGKFMVLEDNLRSPSGVSYVIENRWIMGRIMPELLHRYRVRSIDHYPQMLFDALTSLSLSENPVVAVLTPGTYNSAYFEHAFLADQMGAELVEGRDLVVLQDVLYMKTIAGLKRVDVLYRRVDDDFIDPLVFRPDSVLGVAGLMHAYRSGNVVLANAPGTGIADDKAVYAYTPQIIRYYLNEEPILPIVPTHLCARPNDLAYVLDHLSELVVKPTDASGGYGLLVGSAATKEELARFRARIRTNPASYIAQPIQRLSTHPTVTEEDGRKDLFPRHIDLRPFAVCANGNRVDVLPGGLTRVALPKGSLVVNSSQGGGSKDTWVLHTMDRNSHA